MFGCPEDLERVCTGILVPSERIGRLGVALAASLPDVRVGARVGLMGLVDSAGTDTDDVDMSSNGIGGSEDDATGVRAAEGGD